MRMHMLPMVTSTKTEQHQGMQPSRCLQQHPTAILIATTQATSLTISTFSKVPTQPMDSSNTKVAEMHKARAWSMKTTIKFIWVLIQILWIHLVDAILCALQAIRRTHMVSSLPTSPICPVLLVGRGLRIGYLVPTGQTVERVSRIYKLSESKSQAVLQFSHGYLI